MRCEGERLALFGHEWPKVEMSVIEG